MQRGKKLLLPPHQILLQILADSAFSRPPPSLAARSRKIIYAVKVGFIKIPSVAPRTILSVITADAVKRFER